MFCLTLVRPTITNWRSPEKWTAFALADTSLRMRCRLS